MRPRFFLLGIFGLALPATTGGALAAGCGPAIETAPQGGGGQGGLGGAPSSVTGVGPGGFDDGGLDALPDYVDPGCPDAGLPVMDFQCDPFHQGNGQCGPGEGCYIFVEYPQDPCGQETYGASCEPAGPGIQGSPCDGAEACGAGFACVVSGEGDQCVLLCPLSGNTDCPDGLVCQPIDIEGFGGCL